jgi:hypothetical protein
LRACVKSHLPRPDQGTRELQELLVLQVAALIHVVFMEELVDLRQFRGVKGLRELIRQIDAEEA